MTRFYRWLLKVCVRKLYSSEEQRKEFRRQVNNETWISAQISSGGHSLSASKPICNEEVVSIMCVLQCNRTHIGDESMFHDIDYHRADWKG